MIQFHSTGGANVPADGKQERDAALDLVSDVAQEIDPRIEKRVLRKIDMFLMPAMLIGELHAGWRCWIMVELTWCRLWHCVL